MTKTNEQKLIDIMFEIAMVSATHMKDKSNAEIAAWVSKQLGECGFKTEPCGSSWGILKGEYSNGRGKNYN